MPVQRFRISPTCRGAIFKAKRWFYATFCKKGDQKVLEENKKTWTKLATKLVEEANKLGISDKPVRLTIEYTTGMDGVFKPLQVMLEVFEMRSLGTHTITM
ncbi:MAG: hypothetical protein NZ922_05470 [Candidatus Methanomethyliaceae archaeon]|nr:hypothetical protein [Candidatus Methanomethyliaceae archaeon]MCX8169643.1 hypothetical protein [Candidatus Methanomethyliaceae archaeon]MDW7971424.1 hypothetical protein [Nitrososphaerota archaeon]